MKKLLITFFSSFFVLFLFWIIQGYAEYGDDFVNYRVDLKRTLETLDVEFLVEDVLTTLTDLRDQFTHDIKIDDVFLSTVVDTLSFLLSFIIGFVPLVVAIIGDLLTIIVLILDFVFNPKFVPIK